MRVASKCRNRLQLIIHITRLQTSPHNFKYTRPLFENWSYINTWLFSTTNAVLPFAYFTYCILLLHGLFTLDSVFSWKAFVQCHSLQRNSKWHDMKGIVERLGELCFALSILRQVAIHVLEILSFPEYTCTFVGLKL